MGTQSHKDLIVWQKAMNLVELIYRITSEFPRSEQFGLGSQMTKSAISIPSNIAEGRRRSSRKDYARFVNTAFASAAELETQVEIARRIGYINEIQFEMTNQLIEEVLKILNVMNQKLRLPATS